MGRRLHRPPFPIDAVASILFGLALVVGAVFLTYVLGADLLRWVDARGWRPLVCEVVAAGGASGEFRYSYVLDGSLHFGSAVDIADGEEARQLRAGAQVGQRLECWADPLGDGGTLLDRGYPGWWWLPAVWLVSIGLLVPALRGIRGLREWVAFRPERPSSWAAWRRSLWVGWAWVATLIGGALMVAGLAALKVLTLDPWLAWWSARDWPAVACVMVEGPVRYSRGGGFPIRGGYVMDAAFAYQFGGTGHVTRTHSPWHAGVVDWLLPPPRRLSQGRWIERSPQWALGSSHTCFVSPTQPERAFAHRRWWNGWFALGAAGPVAFLLGLAVVAARPRYAEDGD
ncbi:MAG: DUF3592 domain-containing protein [Ectothiorhodospiraceae bacterium]|nr:DUF3592 domain-containing protein [Ectothiorhodospiraceae bacterium]